MARPPDHSEIAVWQLAVRQSARDTLEHADYLKKLLVDSVDNVLEAERRQISWCGAVKSRREADPCDYTDDKFYVLIADDKCDINSKFYLIIRTSILQLIF